MKTRELLTCDTGILESKIQGLKPKELRRHIDRIAADLGATDTDALLARILEAILALQDPTETASEDETRNDSVTIVRALADHIEVTNENFDPVLRLTLISATYLRHLMQKRAKELHRAERAGHHHAHQHHAGHQCGDPHCQQHGDAPRALAPHEPSPVAPLASGS